MVIFDKKESLEFNKKEQKQLEEIETHLNAIVTLNQIKEPYGSTVDLLDYTELQNFVSHFYDCLNAKVIEIYKKQKELDGLPKKV